MQEKQSFMILISRNHLIRIPEEIFRADCLAIIKHFTQTDLFKFVTSLTKVNFVETYENKQAPKPKSDEKPKAK